MLPKTVLITEFFINEVRLINWYEEFSIKIHELCQGKEISCVFYNAIKGLDH